MHTSSVPRNAAMHQQSQEKGRLQVHIHVNKAGFKVLKKMQMLSDLKDSHSLCLFTAEGPFHTEQPYQNTDTIKKCCRAVVTEKKQSHHCFNVF